MIGGAENQALKVSSILNSQHCNISVITKKTNLASSSEIVRGVPVYRLGFSSSAAFFRYFSFVIIFYNIYKNKNNNLKFTLITLFIITISLFLQEMLFKKAI